MKAAIGLALAFVIALAASCSGGDQSTEEPPEASPPENTVQADAEAERAVPFPPSENIVEYDPPPGATRGEGVVDFELDLETNTRELYGEVTELDKEPVVLLDDGTLRIELTSAFLVGDRELWNVTWQVDDRTGASETDVHEPVAQCAARELEPQIGPFAAELVARSVNPNPDSRFPQDLLVLALLECDGRSELLREFPEDGFDQPCLEAMTDEGFRAIAGENIEAAVDTIAPCARPFEDLPDFISPSAAACMQDNSELAFRAGFSTDPQAEILAIFAECLTPAELEQLLAAN